MTCWSLRSVYQRSDAAGPVLLGYPVAFSLAAVGLIFGFIGIGVLIEEVARAKFAAAASE